MFSMTYAPFLIREGVAVFGRPGQAAPPPPSAPLRAAPPRGIGVARHEVKVSPSPHQNFPESSSRNLSGRRSDLESKKDDML